jgi:Zn-dependent M32 family carboxypeptidase
MRVEQKAVDIQKGFYKIILTDLKKTYNIPIKLMENFCYTITRNNFVWAKYMSSKDFTVL